MNLKPSEAGQKWCPFARVWDTSEEGNPGYNRFYNSTMPDATECIGEKCMAWRWSDNEQQRFGYCGLVGKP